MRIYIHNIILTCSIIIKLLPNLLNMLFNSSILLINLLTTKSGTVCSTTRTLHKNSHKNNPIASMYISLESSEKRMLAYNLIHNKTYTFYITKLIIIYT